MHYYQHHIGDFLRDAGTLSNEQLGAYMRLLWGYYKDEKPISGSLEDIAFDVGSTPEIVRQLLRRFFKESPEGWRNGRCDEEILKYRAKSEKAAASANARWNNANALPSDSGRNASAPVSDANQEPITNNQEEANPSSGAGAPSCPHEKIVSRYNAKLPELPAVRFQLWGGARAKALQARWRESAERQNLEWWEGYFDYVRRCPWLMGQNNAGWKADLAWLLNPTNMVKVLEGKYEP